MPQIIGTPFVMVPLHLIKPHNGKPLPAATILTWCWLQHHTSKDTGQCFPTVKKLAEEIGVSRRAVQKSLSHLESLGAVKVQQRQNRPSIYTLVYAKNEPQFTPTAKQGSPKKKPKPKKTKQLRVKVSELQFAPSVNSSSGVNTSSPGGELQFAPLYKEEQEPINNNQLITPSMPPLEVMVTPGDVVLMYNEIFATAKGKHRVRALSAGSKRMKSLKARVKEIPDESYWRELFERASKIPGLLGKTQKWKKGATLDNFLGPGFADKVLNGEYDEWTGDVSLLGSFNEQDRLSKQMDEIRWQIRGVCKEKFEARVRTRDWWPEWKKSLELDLRSRDAIDLLPKCIELARSTWEKLQTEASDEQRVISQKDVIAIQSEER